MTKTTRRTKFKGAPVCELVSAQLNQHALGRAYPERGMKCRIRRACRCVAETEIVAAVSELERTRPRSSVRDEVKRSTAHEQANQFGLPVRARAKSRSHISAKKVPRSCRTSMGTW